MHKCFDAGMNEYLVKGSNVTDKLRALAKWSFSICKSCIQEEDSPNDNQADLGLLVDFLKAVVKQDGKSKGDSQNSLGSSDDLNRRTQADDFEEMSEVVQVLVQACCTQPGSLDIGTAVVTNFGEWDLFCDAFVHFVDNLPNHLRRITSAAFKIGQETTIQEEAKNLRISSKMCAAVLAHEISAQLEGIMGGISVWALASSSATRQVEVLIEALSRETVNLCNVGRLIRLYRTKLGFSAGTRDYKSCSGYMEAVLSFCIFAVDQVQAVHQAMLVGDTIKSISIAQLLINTLPSLHLPDVQKSAQLLIVSDESNQKKRHINKVAFVSFCGELIAITRLAVSVFYIPEKLELALLPSDELNESIANVLETPPVLPDKSSATGFQTLHKGVQTSGSFIRSGNYSVFVAPSSVLALSGFQQEASEVILNFLEAQLNVLNKAITMQWTCGVFLQLSLITNAIDFLDLEGSNQLLLSFSFKLGVVVEKFHDIKLSILSGLTSKNSENSRSLSIELNGSDNRLSFAIIANEMRKINSAYYLFSDKKNYSNYELEKSSLLKMT